MNKRAMRAAGRLYMEHADRIKALLRGGPFPPDRMLGALLVMAEIETQRAGVEPGTKYARDVRAAALESEMFHLDLATEAKRQGWDPEKHMVTDAFRGGAVA